MDFKNYLVPGKTGLLIGIGGVSMSPLAEVLHDAGLDIRGSDMAESSNTLTLRERGIPIHIGHSADNVTDDISFVIRTAAVHDDNPEVHEAHRRGIPVFERTQAWGALMRGYQNALCISGTHGKTTTTSMCTHIMMAAEKDPTVMIGGTLPLLKACHRVGKGNTIIMESCEYYNSFLALNPTIAVVLNIEADHLDFFKDLDDIRHSFRKFAQLLPDDGTLIVNSEIEHLDQLTKGLTCKIVTYGMDASSDYYASNITFDEFAHPSFDCYKGDTLLGHFVLHVPGIHNVSNALASIALADQMGVSMEHTRIGLEKFGGTKRRFEKKGEIGGVTIIDDYAHHPTEIEATLHAAHNYPHKKLWCVFQPHTYTRTKALMDDFAKALTLADHVVLADIYAARETDTLGISSSMLAEKVNALGGCADYFDSFDKIETCLLENCKPGDVLITMGAGDVVKIGEKLLGK